MFLFPQKLSYEHGEMPFLRVGSFAPFPQFFLFASRPWNSITYSREHLVLPRFLLLLASIPLAFASILLSAGKAVLNVRFF